MMEIIDAHTADHFQTVRALLLDYQAELGVDLSFQAFDRELAHLPGHYARPAGRLLLAMDPNAIGCVALRRIDDRRAEMKRLYVRTAARTGGVARMLVLKLIGEAKAAGYSEVVLDTLPTMQAAQRLYENLGFSEIAAYRPNPIIGTRYLGLTLR